MFKRVFRPLGADEVTVFVEGRPVKVFAGDTAAAAVFASGSLATRVSSISGDKRGPFCLMGVCHECLVEIDGVFNQQACQTIVREGMRIKIQQGVRELR